jgi:hypothetical protein
LLEKGYHGQLPRSDGLRRHAWPYPIDVIGEIFADADIPDRPFVGFISHADEDKDVARSPSNCGVDAAYASGP